MRRTLSIILLCLSLTGCFVSQKLGFSVLYTTDWTDPSARAPNGSQRVRVLILDGTSAGTTLDLERPTRARQSARIGLRGPGEYVLRAELYDLPHFGRNLIGV